MALPSSVLPQLGLFLCLTLHLSAAFPTRHNDSCMVFDDVFTTHNSGIKITPGFAGDKTIYTVLVPVNNQVSTVVLQAVDKNNSSVGLWSGAEEGCDNNSTALYHVTHLKDSFITANWVAPNSGDITGVELHVFIVDRNRTATLSSLKLGPKVMPTDFTSTTKISGDSQTTAKTTAKTPAQTTAKTTAKTTTQTTANSFAVRALSSPIAGAFHILLVFLTSKLLF